MYELSKFSEKLSDHKKHIVRYHLAISRFNKLREKVFFWFGKDCRYRFWGWSNWI